MTVPIKSLFVKDAATIRSDILRTISNGLINRGVVDPDVSPGSDYYIWATALANELVVNGTNALVKADAQMPDTATGADLDRLLTLMGLSRRPASSSVGPVIYATTQTGLVAAGAQLLDALGQRFEVSVGGSYANGAVIPVISVDTGKNTNHLAGDTLKWVSPPAFAASTVVVGTGGLTGGADAENDDTARARLLSRWANPPATGNWSDVCAFAEASTPIVQKAFCYPAVNGPSTCHVAVVGYASSASKNRDVDTVSVLPGIINPYVLGKMPEYVETIVTTVANVATDISIGLTLPAAPNAVPSGAGGGWLDATPWPGISGTGSNYANVTAVTSSTVFTVAAPTGPTVNVSRICFLDPTNWTLYFAKVIGSSGVGPYVITIDQPFPNIAAALALGGTGPLIFPAATNTSLYAAALLAQMALMGPGEKTSNTGVLARGYRHPLPTQSWPYSLNATVLKSLSNVGTEVLDVSYYHRSTTTPAIPGSVADPPKIIVPRHIGFYPI